jgi:hypothetical protein
MQQMKHKRKQKYKPKRQASSIFIAGMCIINILGQTLTGAIADSHGDLLTLPCDIRLVFGTDSTGMPSVSYKLGLQIRNSSARHIAGVSIYWLNADDKVISNSGARCGADESGVAPSEAGHCETTVQHIGGPLLQKLGQVTWTEIINYELATFKEVKRCAIIGYDYHSNPKKTY